MNHSRAFVRAVGLVGLTASSLPGCGGHRSAAPLAAWTDPTIGRGIAPEPLAVLEHYAADVDGPTRAAALEVLVRAAAAPGGGPHGVAALWDPEPWVQRAALRALEGRTAEAETLARLTTLAARAEVDPYVRCRAALLLPTPVAESVATTTRTSWTQGPRWRGVPCAAADAVWGSAAALERLQGALADGELALDPDFVSSLASLPLEGLDTALVAGFETADELVRPALSRVLLARGVDAGLAAVRADLDHTDPMVRMESVLLLAEVERPETTQLLQRAAGAQDRPEGQVAALVVAARTGGNFRDFEEAYAGDNRDVRQAAVRYSVPWLRRVEASGTGRGGRKRLERLLGAALVDPDPSTRIEALAQVGRSGSTSLRPVVDALLADTEVEDSVRIAAAEARVALDATAAPPRERVDG